MPESNEIYSEKDLKDLDKVSSEVAVSNPVLNLFSMCNSRKFHA